MTAEHVLAIDEGTTGVRALILDATSAVKGHDYCPIATECPAPGLVEQDPEALWEATLKVIRGALAAARLQPRELAALGIATQRATTVIWDARTGRAIHAALSWQDQRTSARCGDLQREGHWVTPLASATKIEWLLANAPGARPARNRLRAGTIDSWLVWKLSGGHLHVTDPSNASCTGLYDFFGGGWDTTMLQTLGIPQEMLPEIRPSSAVYGHTVANGVGAEVPIAGIAGDQQAAMFGQLCVEPGSLKATFGTSAMFDLHTGESPTLPGPGTYPLVLWQIDEGRPYCLEGSAITAGAAVQWLCHGLGLIERPEDSEALAASVPDSGGVWAVPAFQGLGTPHMDAGARAVFGGISRATTRAHVARALLEGIALRGREVLEALLSSGAGHRPSALRVNGGAARNNLLMQLQADVLGIPVERPQTIEASAVGAAYLAGRAIRLWPDLEALRRAWRLDRVFQPRWSAAEREERWARWQQIISTAIASAR
jgi:glycerol kinase